MDGGWDSCTDEAYPYPSTSSARPSPTAYLSPMRMHEVVSPQYRRAVSRENIDAWVLRADK